MKLHPYRDQHGALYPELDWRWVSGDLIAQYLQISIGTVYNRAANGALGTLTDSLTGVRQYKQQGWAKARLQFRPGVIWQRKRLGRYGDPRFDWQQLQGHVVLFHSAMGDAPLPAQVTTPSDAPPSDAMAELGKAVALALTQSLSVAQQKTITFTPLRLIDEG